MYAKQDRIDTARLALDVGEIMGEQARPQFTWLGGQAVACKLQLACMDTGEQRLRFYRTKDGKNPFEDWFDRLRDRRAQQRIDARLARVRLGNFGDCKPVGQGVLELRVDYGPGYRIYFGRDGKELVILLSGGDKRTQSRDVDRAKSYWTDYKARQAEETDDTRG